MSSEQEPGNEVLFRDGELMVSSARVEQDGFSCAAKYISTVNYGQDNPSRTHAWIGLFACMLAILSSMLYLYLGKLGVGVFGVLHLMVLVISVLIVYLYILVPSTYSIDVSLVNGQNFRIKRHSEKGIKEILAAIKEAVARNRPDAEPANRSAPVNTAPPVNVAPFLNQAPPTAADVVETVTAPAANQVSAVRKFLPFSAGR